MSVLDQAPEPVKTPAEITADTLKTHVRQTYQYIVAAFTEGARVFWANQSGIPAAAIADALGTDGQEVFQLHAKLGELIASVRPESVADGLSVVGEFSYSEDGRVLIPEPPIVPTPEEAIVDPPVDPDPVVPPE